MERDEQNFEGLRRLLALKRHEVPPAGYFNNFSREVISRIKAGERGESTGIASGFSWENTWFGRLWTALEARPAFAALCGMLLCGVMVFGLAYSETGNGSDSPAGIAIFMAPEVAPGLNLAADAPALPASPLTTPVGTTMAPTSTGGIMPASAQPGSLFARPGINVQPASYSASPGQ